MSETNSARSKSLDNIKELRLGLVCYGGVSLAIYMHGVTKEINKLVLASKAFEGNPNKKPSDKPNEVESVYWDVLNYIKDEHNVSTRVIIDVIAGTSAGGINGIFLAKALSHNLSHDELLEIWMDKVDLKRLMCVVACNSRSVKYYKN